MEQSRTERRLAAIMAADILGYSRLVEADESRTLASIKALWTEVIDPLITSHSGRLVKLMGDGAIVEFASVVDAVSCAVAMQDQIAVHQAELAAEHRILFRIGINLGDVVVEGDDLLGDGINVAARLEQLCEPGGVLVSGTAYDHLQGKLGLPLDFAGEQQVKNISRAVRTYRVRMDGSRRRWRLGDLRLRRWPRRAAAAVVVIAVTGASLWWFGSSEGTASAKPAIAVLPFDDLSGSKEAENFAGGLTEEVIAELSRFRELNVLARNTTERFKGEAVDVPAFARELGADYVLEGSVRQVGDQLRVTAQLLIGRDGSHLWAETYDRDRGVGSLETQHELAGLVAAAVGSYQSGAIAAHSFTQSRPKPVSELTRYECVVTAMGNLQADPDRVRRSRQCLEARVEVAPTDGLAWALLGGAYAVQRWWGHGLESPQRDHIDNRRHLADKALDAAVRGERFADGRTPVVAFMLAKSFFAACEPEKAMAMTERAVALAPNDAEILGSLGNYMAYLGYWEQGVAWARQAVELAPTSYAKWWWWAIAKDYWRHDDYENALAAFRRSFMEGLWLSHMQLAYTYPFLNRMDDAKKAVERLRELRPGFTVEDAAGAYRMWCFDEDYIAKMSDALRQAGLPEASAAAVATTDP